MVTNQQVHVMKTIFGVIFENKWHFFNVIDGPCRFILISIQLKASMQQGHNFH